MKTIVLILRFFRNTAPSVLFYMMLLMTGCSSPGPEQGETADTPIQLNVSRFEKDLFHYGGMGNAGIDTLDKTYGDFFRLFAFRVTTLGSRDSALFASNLREFTSDTNFRAVYEACEERFGDFTGYKNGLTEGFSNYHYYFPSKPVPEIITLISAFSYPVICDSLHLGISLDMYLDPGCRFYETLEPPLPNYIRRRMRPEYVVADALKGWAQSDYAVDESQADLVELMISEGRIQYLLRKLLPALHDSLLTGYTASQLQWCKANESQIWSFFIDQKLLYSKDPNVLMKFVGEGPSTNGFPNESPGNIGLFVGTSIVNSYMKSHPDVTLQQLMEEQDLHKLFQESKYRPEK